MSKPRNHHAPKINPVKSKNIEILEEVVLEDGAFNEGDDLSVSCGVCGKTFSSIKSLNIHSKMEHFVTYAVGDNESEYGTVEEEEVIVPTPKSKIIGQNEDILECNVCHKNFSSKTARDNHMQFQHFDPTNIDPLEYCKVKEEEVEEEEEDEQVVYVDVDVNVDAYEEQVETICCRICLKKFVTVAALNNHAMIDHTDVYKNGDAGAWTWELSELDEFYKKKRDKASNCIREGTDYLEEQAVLSALAPEPLVILANPEVQFVIMKDDLTNESDTPKPKTKKKYSTPKTRKDDSQGDDNRVCSECNKVFETNAKLRSHRKHVHRPKSIICEACGRSFISRSALSYHQISHTGEEPFLCSDCPRTFKTKALMKIHHFRYHQHKPHHCDLCNKRFCTEKQLEEHRSMHILEKPFECEFCPHKFNQMQSLIIHLGIAHNKPKPHQCPKCDKSFDKLNALNLHVSMNHPFSLKCDHCPKKFHKKQLLTAHISAIHKANVCEICNKVFNNMHIMKLHKFKVHQISEKISNDKVVVENNAEEDSDTTTSD